MPSKFSNLPSYEKAFIMASIDVRIEDEKKAMDKAKRK